MIVIDRAIAAQSTDLTVTGEQHIRLLSTSEDEN